MNSARELDNLIKILQLTKIEAGIYQGETVDPGWGRVFGGLVVAQALSAVAQEVPPDRFVHSFHSYFLLPGRVDLPIIYQTEVIRDGKSLSQRRVSAIQDGRNIFYMTASFQTEIEGFDHQAPIPQVRHPDQLETIEALAQRKGHEVAKIYVRPPLLRQAFVFKPTDESRLEMNTPRSPINRVWIRTIEPVPDTGLAQVAHEYLLAYVSDLELLGTATFPHGISHFDPSVQVATIDHSMWFHRPFRFDDWLLYSIESPNTSGGRGYATGRFYDLDGRLVASTAQEGVFRRRAKPPV